MSYVEQYNQRMEGGGGSMKQTSTTTQLEEGRKAPPMPPDVVGGMPIAPMYRQLSHQLSGHMIVRSSGGSSGARAQVCVALCTMLCVMAILWIPAIWCLAVYGSSGDLPCDRPIAYQLRFMGFNAILIATLQMLRICFNMARGPSEDDDGCKDPCTCFLFLPSIAQFCQWIWLSGTCFWMYPYPDDVVYQLSINNLTLGHNGTQLGFCASAAGLDPKFPPDHPCPTVTYPCTHFC